MKNRFMNYLYFSRSERLGSMALLLFCVGVFSVPTILQWYRPHRSTDFSEFEATIRAFRQSEQSAAVSADSIFVFDPNTATEADFLRLGLSEKVARNICHFREKGGQFREADDFKKIWSLEPEDFERLRPFIRIGGDETPSEGEKNAPAQAFQFDPNIATEGELMRLGLPERTVKSILNYRSKGGMFRKKEDLAKIYTLSETDYQRLEPYINILFSGGDTLRAVAFAGGGGFMPQKAPPKSPVDLNGADVEDLVKLPLVGEKRASQIISFRDKLGGFLFPDQLAEMYNLPDSVFQRIRPYITASSAGVRKININTATLAELDAHPYISHKQAELITAYREQHGAFAKPDDVLNIKAFTDKAWWDKVGAYFRVE